MENIQSDLRLINLCVSASSGSECHTALIWHFIFPLIFRGKSWLIASQQPPTDKKGDLRRVDIVILHADKNGTWRKVLFVELKLASAGPALVLEVEGQAYTACCGTLDEYQEQTALSMTCFGQFARIWGVERGEEWLTPLVPVYEDDGSGDRDKYIDLMGPLGYELWDKLSEIRDRISPLKTFGTHSPPRPRNATLPKDWSFDEVAHVTRIPWDPVVALPSLTSAFTPSLSHNKSYGSLARRSIKDTVSIQVNPDVKQSPPDEGIYVDTWFSNEYVRFRNEKGIVQTDLTEWVFSETLYEGQLQPIYTYTSKKSMNKYWTWRLGNLEVDPLEKGKGTERRH